MPKKPRGKANGRPRKELDVKLFESLCRIQCTEVECASVLGMSVDTLEARVKEIYNTTFSEALKELGAGGKASLRRFQWDQAKRNATMAIWLGKQYLGQSDKAETKNDVIITEIKHTIIDPNE